MKLLKTFLIFIILLVLASGCGNRIIDPLVPVTNSDKTNASLLAEQVSENRLRSYVSNIFNERRYSQSERDLALASIESEVSGLNYLETTQDFSTYGYDGRNLILTKTGAITPNNWVVIMAHYDSVYSTLGADDNGSSCAALIEIAKILSPITFESSLKLVFVDLEEPGLLGSQYFVSQIPATVNIIAAISLEMIGYTSSSQQNYFPAPFDVGKGDFLAVIGDGKSFAIANDFVRHLKQTNSSLSTIIVNPDEVLNNPILQDLTRSDHASFWEQGMPAIMLTDTANFRNPNYHEWSDSINTLDFSFLTKITQAVVVSCYLWANPQ
jgi:Zn-dependent M28 family amino/carboxypeptidase